MKNGEGEIKGPNYYMHAYMKSQRLILPPTPGQLAESQANMDWLRNVAPSIDGTRRLPFGIVIRDCARLLYDSTERLRQNRERRAQKQQLQIS